MKDLTEGAVTRHILSVAWPISAAMIVQTIYFLIDLHFIGSLGSATTAGASAGATALVIVTALSQVLGGGVTALISHCVGRKDHEHANLIFNKSLSLSLIFSFATLIACYSLAPAYMRALSTDTATVEAGIAFLYWVAPSQAIGFPTGVIASALRGTGVVKPTMVAQLVSVVLNAILAPVLISGWGTNYPMGAAGAGLATTIAVAFGAIVQQLYFAHTERYLAMRRSLLKPSFEIWRRVFGVGLPMGGESILLFAYSAFTYWCIARFGATVQAGFGIASRILFAIIIPVTAIAAAASLISGQNFGARRYWRIREAFAKGAFLSTAATTLLLLSVQVFAEPLVAGFTNDVETRSIAVTCIRIMSIGFLAQGFIFMCTGLFQALGDTRPAILSASSRLLTFVAPTLWLSSQPFFRLEHIWYLTISAAVLQSVLSLTLLRAQMRRLSSPPASSPSVAVVL